MKTKADMTIKWKVDQEDDTCDYQNYVGITDCGDLYLIGPRFNNADKFLGYYVVRQEFPGDDQLVSFKIGSNIKTGQQAKAIAEADYAKRN